MVRQSASITVSLIAMFACFVPACRKEQAIPPEQETPKANVVLISVDTLRPDHLGCYGYERSTSPNIDRLAADGVVFENTVSSTSWTLPAHAAMFTGLADSVHGCVDTNRRLAANRKTLAERLKEQGYATAGFFSGPYLHPVFGLGQGFDKYVDCTSYARLNAKIAAETGRVDGRPVWSASHRDITSPQVYEQVSAWLHNERPKSEPFFLFIHLWDVHFDFIPPSPYDSMFDPDYKGSQTGRNFLFDSSINENMPEADFRHLVALYDGEIAWTDMHIGKILDDLSSLGLNDTTLVVLTADHGTEFFEHRLKGHRQTLYNEVIRIPLVMRFPGIVPAGQKHKAQARMVDIVPTVMDLAGFNVPLDVMGQSLSPVFHGETLENDNLAVAELLCNSGKLLPNGKWQRMDRQFPVQLQLRSFQRLDRKTIVDLNRHNSLVFNLEADPAELNPLTGEDDPLRAKSQADAEFGTKWTDSYRKALPAGEESSEIPEEVLEQLRSLGYINQSNSSDDAAKPE